MKKLYTVTVEYDVVVIAGTEDEAEEEAEEAVRSGDVDISNVHASGMRYLPGDWDLDSIPYGAGDDGDPDRTIQGWIDVGAGEDYKSYLAKLSKSSSYGKE